MKPTHLDLFSGIGGFSLAAEWAGFQTIAHCEIDPEASLVLSHFWPETPNLKDARKLCIRAYDCETNNENDEYVWCNRCNADFGDCECVGADDFLDEYGSPDLLTAGVPCQPASLIGKRGGTSDDRWLWPDTIRVVRETRPRFFVAENPPALASLESGRAINRIAAELAALGYDLWWDVIPACAVGAGHRRERLFIVAADSNSQRSPGLPIGTHEEHTIPAQSCSATPSNSSGVSRREQDSEAFPCRGQRQTRISSQRGGEEATHSDSARLQGHSGMHPEQNTAGEKRFISGRHASPESLRHVINSPDWWREDHTGIPVLAHGIPARLAEAYHRCIGNSVVPQVAYQILKPIFNLLANPSNKI